MIVLVLGAPLKLGRVYPFASASIPDSITDDLRHHPGFALTRNPDDAEPGAFLLILEIPRDPR